MSCISALQNLAAHNKLDLVKGRFPKPAHGSQLYSNWERCNNLVISWILHSIETEISESVIYCTSAQEIWEELEQRFGRANGPKIFQLQKELNNTIQGDQSVTTYFGKLKSLWDEVSNVLNIPACSCATSEAMAKYIQNQRLIQFLMGLNKDYKTIRGSILMISPLPTVSQAYSLILQEEQQREISYMPKINTEASAMSASSRNFNNQSTKDNVSSGQNNYALRRNSFYCTHCKMVGHSNEKCFRLHPKLRISRHKRLQHQAHMVNGELKESNAPSSTVEKFPLLSPDLYQQLLKLLQKNEVESSSAADCPQMMAGPFDEQAAAETW